ncbi:toxin, partial [Enterovibrio nigricans]
MDKGLSKAFYDAEGRVLWQIDAKETEQSFAYDELGRPITRTETDKDQHSRIAERWVYGEKEGAPEEKNLRGRAVRFYDTAGLVDYSELGFALIGQPLQQKRQLLPMTTESDWQGEEEAQWQSVLEETVFSTLWQYTASGQLAQQTDAKGHIQRSHFDVVGRLAQSWVKVKDGAEQEVLKAVSYNASGQKLTEVSGNGVETRFSYEPKTLRLSTVKSTRSNGECVQSLSYLYDPVGNITDIQDTNVATRYYKNQKTDGNKTFVYDSLYQLISGGGRENSDGSGNHDDAALQSIDSDNYIAYTRSYGYDRGGNLTQVKHNGATQFTRNIAVSECSNHALIDKDNNLTTDGIEEQFDAAGNQLSLDNGNALSWNTAGQLSSVTMIARANEPDDAEYYQYSGKGMRVRKKDSRQASGTVNTQEVIYLPGLELRCSKNGDVISEALETLTLSASGQHQARLLNWTEGKPTDIDNHQVRFSLNDQLGSSVIELDYNANILTKEEYYPFGGTSVRASKSETEVKYKTVRYSGKERDSSGLYYYGFRYYQPWSGRWLSADPAGTIDGLNLYRMVRNNPTTSRDPNGLFSIANTLVHKGLKKADKYIDNKITHYLEKKGCKTSTILKVNKVRRTIFMGIGLGSLIGGIASGFGAGLGVAIGVGAIGFAIGASVGWFANKLSNKFAGAMAEKVQGSSDTVQMAAGGTVAQPPPRYIMPVLA